jgi:small subunit ribosomal protein S3
VKLTIETKFIDDAMVKLNISKYLSKELTRAGFSRVEIQKTPILTRITVFVLNPGRVIGRGGHTIDKVQGRKSPDKRNEGRQQDA